MIGYVCKDLQDGINGDTGFSASVGRLSATKQCHRRRKSQVALWINRTCYGPRPCVVDVARLLQIGLCAGSIAAPREDRFGDAWEGNPSGMAIFHERIDQRNLKRAE